MAKAYDDILLGTVAHEIGHGPGANSEDDDHAEEGLMQEGGAAIDTDFKPETIKRFRETTNW